MKRWAFLLRPGSLALALVVVAFAYLCFTVLAPWQLGKNTKTNRENSQIAVQSFPDPSFPVYHTGIFAYGHSINNRDRMHADK